jgi:hypothetical protein
MERELRLRGAIIQFMYLMFEQLKNYGWGRTPIPHQEDLEQSSVEI